MIINQIAQGGGNLPDYYTEFSHTGTTLNKPKTVVDIRGITTLGTSALRSIYNYAALQNNQALDFSSVTTVNESSLRETFYYSTGSFTLDLSGITTISVNSACSNMCCNCGVTSVNLNKLKTVSGSQALYQSFQGSSNLTSFDLSNLQSVSGNQAFYNAFHTTGVTYANLPNLTSLTSSYACSRMFYQCTALTGFNMDKLYTLSGQQALNECFLGCTSLTTGRFPSLRNMTNTDVMKDTFRNCTNLESLWFYDLRTNSFSYYTSQFNGMLRGVTGCTVHFPMSVQSTIGSWTSVTGGFNGTNTIVLFDIVQTLTGADTNSYVRSEKDSTSTANAWLYNSTLYYTSGTAEPHVGDTIYSDSACTTAVTTISAIA